MTDGIVNGIAWDDACVRYMNDKDENSTRCDEGSVHCIWFQLFLAVSQFLILTFSLMNRDFARQLTTAAILQEKSVFNFKKKKWYA